MSAKLKQILVLHGPNLNALGTREPAVYGRATLDDINGLLDALALQMGCKVECRQTNHEGVLIDALHSARGNADGVLLNPGGLTHSSVALRDAVLAAGIPVVEVHLSNLRSRDISAHFTDLRGRRRGGPGFRPGGLRTGTARADGSPLP
jgi:3-dehydroquinate dehydratase-2